MTRLLKLLFHMLFRLFFTLEYYGVENIPKTGPAVLAGNHPSYMDPILIYIASKRPVSFLAWDKIFTIPILGWFVKSFGAIPVNVTARDSNAFEQAMKVLERGDLLGIFPEAGRSKQGVIEESLKTGAARLAIFNSCPLVPITITGAYEAWPVTRLFPLPRKITVKFHEPIQSDPETYKIRRNDAEFHDQLTEAWRERVNQRLLPGLKAQEAFDKHFARPASHLRIYELVPIGAFLIMLSSPLSRLHLALPIITYYAYLLLDIWALPQGRITKIARDLATPLLMLVWYPILANGIEMPQVESLSLSLAVAGLLVPYYWTSYYDTQRFARGLVLTYFLGLTLEIFNQTQSPFGLHWAFVSYTFFFNIYHRTTHWYYQVAFILLYGIAIYIVFNPLSTPAWGYYLLLGILINVYMIVFKFTAHDGRRI
jgi:1-acyl-sn-glycerol-3-phosphate acyltransferase